MIDTTRLMQLSGELDAIQVTIADALTRRREVSEQIVELLGLVPIDSVDGGDEIAVAAEPEPFPNSPPGAAPATDHPEPGQGAPNASQAPARHATESFICSRCPATFKRRGWRDRHETSHPPVPDVTPRGGERVVRRPPATEAVTGAPFNGSTVAGQ